MLLAEKLATQPELRGEAFNFSNEIQVNVLDLTVRILKIMDSDLEPDIRNEASNEIKHQYLSAEKARKMLNWSPLFTLDRALETTVDWYKEFLDKSN
jgi:CDP-glucose 4,6-dehydratase